MFCHRRLQRWDSLTRGHAVFTSSSSSTGRTFEERFKSLNEWCFNTQICVWFSVPFNGIVKCWLNEERRARPSIQSGLLENAQTHCALRALCCVCVWMTSTAWHGMFNVQCSYGVANKTERQRLHSRSCNPILEWTFSRFRCIRCGRCHRLRCSRWFLCAQPICVYRHYTQCDSATWKQRNSSPKNPFTTFSHSFGFRRDWMDVKSFTWSSCVHCSDA